jgi:hypothetical protein
MLIRKTALITLFCFTVYFLMSLTSHELIAAEQSESNLAARSIDRIVKARSDLELVNFIAMRLAVKDLIKNFPEKYTNGEKYLRAVDKYENRLPKIKKALERGETAAAGQVDEIVALQRLALLSNPLLDFDELLLIKRKPLDDPRRANGDEENDKGLGKFLGLPQQSSWQLHTMPNVVGWENEISVLSPVRQAGRLTTVYKPSARELVNEMDLHFDAEKIMFSMPDKRKLWQVFEINIDGTNLRQISPDNQPDVHNFDSCYLPNGKIAFIWYDVSNGQQWRQCSPALF